jgi:hypothetical protein
MKRGIAIVATALMPWAYLTVAALCSFGSPSAVSIETILSNPYKFDKKIVTVSGELMIGDEMSILKDPLACGTSNVKGCALWVSLRSCNVIGGPNGGHSCSEILGEIVPKRQHQFNETIVTISHVTLHGLILTKRGDLKYAPDVPPSARVGFGHLGAYPAELRVDRMELPSDFH